MSSAMMVAAGAKSFNSQMLRPERDAERRDARDIRAWVIEAGDGPDRHRVRSHLVVPPACDAPCGRLP
jgi:hypothetical protein